MAGDSRNPKVSLLKKYDIPIDHLTYDYVEKCSNKKELERIIRILRSGEEGSYPDLLRVTEERLRSICPESRVLRVEAPILTKESLTSEEWNAVENELLSWEEEMKVMDKSLDFEKSRIEIVGNKNMPSVRKVSEPKTKPQKTKSQTNDKNMRIKSGDYAAWDKFDVDKELLKIDVEEERKQEENEKKKREVKKQTNEKKIEILDVDKESYSSIEQQVLANQAKDRGNECYKSGDMEKALKYYDISIRLCATANAYNNRAMTYLKLQKYDNVVDDCNKVLQLEKNNIKALHRRATAYQNLSESKEKNNFNELALQDLLKIVLLEPNNKIAQLDLQKLKNKLKIEDTGKKFRMAISESERDMDVKMKQALLERNAGWDVKDVSLDRLPLTYYGPSTSTFQCEPYSMVHRALSGTTIPGQVMCKCNSNRPRQNPLCQRCGEAMCRPKPSKKAIKPKAEIKSNPKEDNEVQNKLLRKQTNKIVQVKSMSREETEAKVVKSTIGARDEPSAEEKTKRNLAKGFGDESKTNPVTQAGPRPKVVQSIECKIAGNSESKSSGNTLTVENEKSGNQVVLNRNSLACNEVSISNETKKEEESREVIVEKKELPVENATTDESRGSPQVGYDNNNPEISSSQNDVNRPSKKVKNKKKKPREVVEPKTTLRKHLEPVKIVHAAKYLHPTSVEPKAKQENSLEPKLVERDSSHYSNGQFKAFVPNKKCFSAECKKMGPPSGYGKNSSGDQSLEGNKENILKNKNILDEKEEKEVRVEDGKKYLVRSAFEFIKTWEELKKIDESYAKRAEIILTMEPVDLSKVIGIKLDSEMLSCLLECLERHIVEKHPKTVVDLLKQLPQVPRYELVSMFLSESDKKKMMKLIETAERKGFKLEEDVKKALSMTS